MFLVSCVLWGSSVVWGSKEFRNQVGRSLVGTHLKNSQNVWVIQGCGRASFLLKSTHAVGILGKRGR